MTALLSHLWRELKQQIQWIDNWQWDRQMDQDAKNGQFDTMIDEARSDQATGKAKPMCEDPTKAGDEWL